MTPRTSRHARPPVPELNPEPYYESFEITDRHGRVVTIEELEATIEGRLLNIDLPNGETLRYADERAALFFMTDRSAVGPESYDAWVGSPRNKTDAITHDDLTTINRTMRARTPSQPWEDFITGTKVASLKAALRRSIRNGT